MKPARPFPLNGGSWARRRSGDAVIFTGWTVEDGTWVVVVPPIGQSTLKECHDPADFFVTEFVF
jgi:hypothetical protein